MKAAVLYGNEDIRYADWDTPVTHPGEVKVHVRAILRALNVDSRTEAVVVATRMGLVPPTGAVAASGSLG